jgi:hypothetical protein
MDMSFDSLHRARRRHRHEKGGGRGQDLPHGSRPNLASTLPAVVAAQHRMIGRIRVDWPVAGDFSRVAADGGVIFGGTSTEARFRNPAPMTDPPRNDVAAAAGQLLSLLSNATHLDLFLERMVHLAAEVVTPSAACGLTLRRDCQPFTVVSSDGFAAQADEIQYGANEGPCLESLRHGVVVQVDDLSRDSRWPRYRPHAVAHGVVSSLSLPLTVGGQTVAALNLYADRPAAFAGAARQHATVFAAQGAAALALALRQFDQAQIQQQLLEAVTSRSVIDQAIGILMSQQRCNATVAFDLLRQASQHRNRRLRDIAVDIVTNVTGEPPRLPTPFVIQPIAPAPTDRN